MMRRIRKALKSLVNVWAVVLVFTACVLLLSHDIAFNLYLMIRSQLSITKLHVPLPQRHKHGLDCSALFKGDLNMIEYAENLHYETEPIQYTLGNMTCDDFKTSRRYVLSPLNKEEARFSIAFSILMYKDPSQVERLLRAIYRPQNAYCIHVDQSSSKDILNAMSALAECFPNVIIVDKLVDVSWGTWSVVEAELRCMSTLLDTFKKWRYFINLAGQEFPLKTNLDLVRILKALNNSNAVQAVQGVVKNRWWSLPPPPLNVTLIKGECHIAVTRNFVRYVLNDKRALTFKDWAKHTEIPDELYFPTMSHNPQLGVPGAYTGVPQIGVQGYQYITRYKCWTNANCTCHGTERRWLCILGPGDLQTLVNRHELFVNKFQIGYQPAAMDCMEELLFNRTRDQLAGTAANINISFYQSLPNVKYHI